MQQGNRPGKPAQPPSLGHPATVGPLPTAPHLTWYLFRASSQAFPLPAKPSQERGHLGSLKQLDIASTYWFSSLF